MRLSEFRFLEALQTSGRYRRFTLVGVAADDICGYTKLLGCCGRGLLAACKTLANAYLWSKLTPALEWSSCYSPPPPAAQAQGMHAHLAS